MFRPRIFSTLLLAVALALTLGASRASADIATSSLTVPNTAISAFPGPYGEVTVNLNAATQVATITFTADNNYMFGDGSTVGVNVNATTFTHSATATESNSFAGFTPTFKDFSSGNVDGFGNFNLTVDNSDGFGDSATTVSFTVTNTSATPWASATNVLTLASGFDAVAHIFVPDTNPPSTGGGATNTGFAAENTPFTVVPEPSTMAIAGLGALGFIGYGLRRRLKK